MTTLPASLERELSARLDFSRACHCGRGEACLSRYIGSSPLAHAVEELGVDAGDLADLSKRSKSKRNGGQHGRKG